ncbi:Putative Polyketide synthase [[Torrubiella] hemipterigena]|uniref:Putative Polyketide synthase n=1 Tax=[Torrubiella] hemipterigena TaxID=1531966 RepID=A0A0A1TFJ7_9HYPO|nr:Putative Polyketide synthase [[Torrubiella] hemipterigena]
MDDIAVIGLGLRFPGKANTPEGLWEVMVGGESQWSEFPKDRLNIDGYFHPSGNRQGSISFRGAHFLKDDVSLFDAPFFSVPADDAKAIDPQQRILLEVSYEALESAGLRKEDLDGSDTAVYVGSFVKDYEQICLRDPDWQPQYAATGNGIAIMSNRISYSFNMHGPSMTVDTGCSGSLVSVHLAAQSLRNGESKVAIAAGAGLILTPNSIMPMTALNFLSPNGKCFTFDARANGYGRGEGIGVVVMKRLEDALRDNDPIRSVIRATSVNQDGKTTGITLPSKEAQVANIRSVYASANLDFNQTGYVECHGTGTQAGDWRELKAVSETIASVRSRDNPIYVGSVKPNIGHLEGAAGVAGLIKAVLMLEKGQIPPQTNFENGNPEIDFEEWKVKVPREVTPWPVPGLKRISVNCFGFGGTNAHVIMDESPKPPIKIEEQAQTTDQLALEDTAVVEAVPEIEEDLINVTWNDSGEVQADTPLIDLGEPQVAISATIETVEEASMPVAQETSPEEPVVAAVEPVEVETPPNRLFFFSSNHKNGLLETMAAQADHISRNSTSANYLDDLSYTLTCRRSNLDWRAFTVASSTVDLHKTLVSYNPDTAKSVPFSTAPCICFTFCGQGAQWAGMGTTLKQYAPFWDCIISAGLYFKAVLAAPFDLVEELLKDEAESSLSAPHISQPATTAVQVALVELYRALGIVPDVVIGHSSGEIAAAFATGAISRESAWRIAYQRGAHVKKLTDESQQPGAMVAVTASAEEVNSLIEESDINVHAACINSRNSVTVSGVKSDVESFAELLESRQIFNRILAVDAAYHSPYMKAAADGYLSSLADLPAPSDTPIKFISSMKGTYVPSVDLSGQYWVENLVSPVQYAAAISFTDSLPKGERPDAFIEMSPSSVLRNPTLDGFHENKKPVYVSSMRRKRECEESLLESLGLLWAAGVKVDMKALAHITSPNSLPQCLTDLPSYRWNHSKSYWHESHLSLANRFREFGRHDLIGAPTADSVPFEPRWRGFLRVHENPWILNHKVQNLTIYPAAGMIAMVLEAASQVCAHDFDVLSYEITDMHIEQALIIPETEHGLEYAFNMKQLGGGVNEKGPFEFCIYSKGFDIAWSRHATGNLSIRKGDSTLSNTDFASKHADAASRCTRAVETSQVYDKLAAMGLSYGQLFRNMKDLMAGDNNNCVATITVPDTKSTMPANYEYPHLIHPATLDSFFQTLLAIQPTPKVPTYFEKIVVSAKGTNPSLPIDAYGSVEKVGERDVRADIHASDSSGFQIAITGLTLSAFQADTDTFISNRHNLCTTISWGRDIAFLESMTATDMIIYQCFKTPAVAVLQIGGSAAFALTLMTSALHYRATKGHLIHYTVVDADDALGSKLVDGLKGTTLEGCFEHVRSLEEANGRYNVTFVFDGAGEVSLENKGRVFYQQPIPDTSQADDDDDDKPPTLEEDLLMYEYLYKPFVGVVLPPDVGPVRQPHVSIVQRTLTPPGRKQRVAWYLNGVMDIIADILPDISEDLLATDVANAFFESKSEAKSSSQSIVVLMPTSCDVKVRMFAKCLNASLTATTNAKVTTLTLSDLQQDTLCDKDVISLLELADEASLHETIFHWDEHSFQTFQRIATTCKRLLCVTRESQRNDSTNPKSAALLGLTRTLRSENPRCFIGTLDLSAESISPNANEIVTRVWHQFTDPTSPLPTEFEYAERDGQIQIPRLELSRDLNAVIERPNDSYTYSYAPFDKSHNCEELYLAGDRVLSRDLGHPADNQVQILFEETFAFGSKDDFTIGADFHGKIHAVGDGVTRFNVGDQVTAFIPHADTVNNFVCVDQWLAAPFTEGFIPSLHVAAYYGLVTRARLKDENDSDVVLVHGGATPHGKAAIQVLAAYEIRIVATLLPEDDDADRNELEALGVPAEDIININSNLPASLPSVDVVYDASGVDTPLHHLKKTGILLRLASNPPLTKYTPIETIITIDIAQLSADSPSKIASIFHSACTLAHSNPNIFTAPTYRKHTVCNFTSAITTLTPRTPIAIQTSSTTLRVSQKREIISLKGCISSNRTYVLVGGLGGLGRKIAQLLIAHGAKYLHFISRSTTLTSERQTWLDGIRSQGISVEVLAVDITDPDSLSVLPQDIEAVFHCAAVIEDSIFDNMTYTSWKAALAPKFASWNIVHASPTSAIQIFLSSSAGIIGARGQSNYAAGNTFLDSLAGYCLSRGQPAVSLDLGPIVGAGMLLENEDTLRALRSSGFIEIHYDDFLTILGHALRQQSFAGSATPKQVVLGVGTGGLLLQNNPADPYWSGTAIYAALDVADLSRTTYVRGDAHQTKSSKLDLANAQSATHAAEMVCAGLRAMMARAMSMPEEDIDVGRPPKAYGVDSLVAVGIRNWIGASCEVDVSVFELLSDASIFEVAEGVVAKLQSGDVATAGDEVS